jgi:N-acetylglucosaminyldiphosphoundecaprenol N-acetyl-beta-D-mannosaminyltransferase
MINFAKIQRRSNKYPFMENISISVNVFSKTELINDLCSQLSNGRGFTVATLNLDHLVKIRKDAQFAKSYSNHTHVTADGNPIVWLHAISGKRINLVPGSTVIEPLIKDAAKLSVPVALFGSTEDSLRLAAEYLEARIPNIFIVAKIAPPMGFDPTGPYASECIAKLKASGAQLCIVALGAPKQEVFAHYASLRLPKMGFISIGAGLDFLSGKQRRAPHFFQRLALEWLWRLCSNPRKFIGRYAACLSILPAATILALRYRWRQF